MPIRHLAVSVLALALACASSEPRPPRLTRPPLPTLELPPEHHPSDAGTHGLDVAGMDRSVAPGTTSSSTPTDLGQGHRDPR
jgi:hypothetical protein